MVKNLSAVQETRVCSLGWEDPLEAGMAAHSWRIPWTEEPGGLQSVGSQRARNHGAAKHSTQSDLACMHVSFGKEMWTPSLEIKPRRKKLPISGVQALC